MPVWGFAEVAREPRTRAPAGARVYGYLPPSTHLLVSPARVGRARLHRRLAAPREAAGGLQHYARTDADPVYDAAHEDQQMLLRPLFFTSWLLDDFLARGGHVRRRHSGALECFEQDRRARWRILLSLRDGIEVIGLTSARSAEFARGLGVYDAIVTYDELDSLPQGRAVYVDMAGDAELRSAVHTHYGAELAHSAVVGRHPPRQHGRRAAVAAGAAPDVLLRTRPCRPSARPIGAAQAWRHAWPTLGTPM